MLKYKNHWYVKFEYVKQWSVFIAIIVLTGVYCVISDNPFAWS